MEKIKVNMTPNPLDVQTIHASQNDTEARQWEFELHNNGELIDTSDVKEQLVFKAYKGGTEQLLPENGSVPTTAPFLGDIKYPQGLLADQEFTYRQSPTESDGLAKITDIKGNTLVWNQLQQSASASQTINGITYTVNNDGSITANGTATATSIFYLPRIGQLYANHKYLVKGCPSGGTSQTYMLTFRCNAFSIILGNETGNGIIVNGQDYSDGQIGIRVTSGVTLNNAKFYPQAFDLTKMGLDSITSVDEFTSLFSLPYYDFNAGSLLSFNGAGIKTTGKNLCPKFTNGSSANLTYTVGDDGSVKVTGTNTGASFHAVKFTLPAGTYILSGAPTNGQLTIRSGQGGGAPSSEFSGVFDDYGSGATFKVSATATAWLNIRSTAGTHDETYYPMIRFADTDDTYEPYTESTASLPISTYFPNGMKSAGNVYDELTESKAITRMGDYTFNGNETWSYSSSARFWQVQLSITNYAKTVGAEKSSNGIVLKFVNNYYARAYLDDNPSLSDSSAMNTVFSNGTQIVYELATPTETSFTTASLVTENAEIPLSNEDGTLIGKCTEELSENPGFIDAKIKLSDSDGTCYSNKIQLHVERSPQ